MSEMVQRVALAICDHKTDTLVLMDPPSSQHQLVPCKGCIERAKAAIAAMREPTDEMIRAWALDHCTGDPDEMVPVPGTGNGDFALHEMWRKQTNALRVRQRHAAMIDEALKD